MHLGFTGTQKGMTPEQRNVIRDLLRSLTDVTVHYGDCIGADNEFFEEALRCGAFTISHPPVNESKRAFTPAHVVLEAKDYIARNHDIVDASVMLIAAPAEYGERLRSGTWATIRYARKVGTPVMLIWPVGDVE